MSGSRLVHTKRWTDKWFLSISNNAKVLYDYLGDHCDSAGVYEMNIPHILFNVKINESELQELMEELNEKILVSKDGELIFIKSYLKHQKKLPLRPKVGAHVQVIRILLRVLPRFKPNSDITDLIPTESLEESGITPSFKSVDPDTVEDEQTGISSQDRLQMIIAQNSAKNEKSSETKKKAAGTSGKVSGDEAEKAESKNDKKKKTRGRKTFKPPTQEEVYQHMLERAHEKGHAEDEYPYELWAENCFLRYDSLGWRVSGQQAKSWKAIASRWYNNNMEGGQYYNPKSHKKAGNQNKTYQNEKKSKVETIIDSNVIGKVDFNQET